MAIRNFIFCDLCNPMGFRSVEDRRQSLATKKPGSANPAAGTRPNPGRRIGDGRAWLEGDRQAALDAGWHEQAGQYICPRCYQRTQARGQ